MGSEGTSNVDLDAWRCHDADTILGSTWLRSVAAWTVLAVMGMVAAFGPVVLLTALGVGLLGGILWAGDRLISRARFGQPAALGLEGLAAVIVVPGAFFAASTGISVAFYVMSRPSGTPDAVTVLLYTGVLSVEVAWLSVRSLVRHRSGAEISPFERDVEPGAALTRIAQLHNARGPLLVTGQRAGSGAMGGEEVRDVERGLPDRADHTDNARGAERPAGGSAGARRARHETNAVAGHCDNRCRRLVGLE